ncbi:MAG TPA: TetR family transcriptional regulator [Gaiellaceae bacterium]|nr:TetR family transcriptional regulator [Gaiellaceae bacterium]
MAEPAVDHRRAIAERNAAAILDATERLLAERGTLSMAAIASEAGVSRPTLYAHFRTLGDVVEAAVGRVIGASLAAVEAADPDAGPADEALERMLATSWSQLARQDALARVAAEHVPSGHLHRAHAPLMARTRALLERGQREGVFRSDLPADWLVTVFYALVHGADEHARAQGMDRADGLELLSTTIRDVVAPR